VVAIERLAARGAKGGGVAIEGVRLDRADVEAARRADGTLVLAGLGLVPKKAAPPAAEEDDRARTREEEGDRARGPGGTAPRAKLAVGAVEVRRVNVALHDEMVEPATDVAVAI